MKKTLCLLLLLPMATLVLAQKENQGKDQKNNGNQKSEAPVEAGNIVPAVEIKKDEKAEEDEKAEKAEKKDTIKLPREIRYQDGASGVKRSIHYTFNLSPEATDPGKGTFRYNSGKISDVSFIYVNNNDLSGDDQSKWFSTWDDTTGATGRGRISVVEAEGKNVDVFDVSGVFIKEPGFWKIPVEYVSGNLPASGSTCYYVFERIAKKKSKAPEIVENVVSEIVDTAKNIIAELPKAAEPVELPKPVEEVKPVEQPQPVEEAKPVEQPKPLEEVKPVEQPTPVEEVKPIEQPKPVEEVKPVEQPKPVEEVKPVEQPKPVEEVKPVEQPKPVEEVKPVEQPKPVEEVKPVEQPKPVEEVKPVEQPKPVEEIKPVEQPKPVEEVKPAEQPKPAEKPAPVARTEQPARQTTRETVNRTTPTQPGAPRKPAEQTPQPAAQKPVQQPAPVNKPVNQPPAPTNQPQPSRQPAQQPPAPVYQNRPANQYNANNSQYTPGVSQFASRSHGKCYAGIIEAGYGLGVGKDGIDNFRFNFINGFHIGPTFTLGLGIGVRRYYPDQYPDKELVSKVQVPVFIDLRKTFSTRTITPYLALGLGGASGYVTEADSAKTVSEGFLFNPSGGIWINISSRFAVFAGIAYEMQKMEFLNLNDDSKSKKNAGSVSLNIGISF